MLNGSQWHNDKGRAKTSLKKYTSHFICNVCVWEGVGDRTKTAIYWPHSYGHQRCVFLILLILNRRPGGSAFCWVLAFSTTSYHQRVSKTTGSPKGPFSREWLSLPHLISNFSGPQLNRGPRAPSAWCSFPYHISSLTPSDF